MSNGNKIDFVLLWVDGSDKEWRKERDSYRPSSSMDNREVRYRDWGLLRYWFRGVEKFAPWVNKVYFVTYGHLPLWLNLDNPKLRIVKHSDFMPFNSLPTFNSNALELNLHRIVGLENQFVLFNDDVFLIDKVEPSQFFDNGRPCDMAAFEPLIVNHNDIGFSYMMLNNSAVIARYFTKSEFIKRNWSKLFFGTPLRYSIYNLIEMAFPYYTGFHTVHGPAPMLKTTYQKLWSIEDVYKDLITTTNHKFRSREDVTQYLFREWNKQEGNFRALNLYKTFRFLTIKDALNIRALRHKLKGMKIICINDSDSVSDSVRMIKENLRLEMNRILGDKSSFEV